MNPTMIAGGVALGAFALAGVQTWRLGNAQEEIGELKAKVEFQVTQTMVAVGVNEKNLSEITGLANQIADMIESRRLEREERDRVLLAREEDLMAANELARRLEGERDAIFRTSESCDAMGSIRIDSVCPAIANQLRERADRGSGEGSGDGGSDGGGDPTVAIAAH